MTHNFYCIVCGIVAIVAQWLHCQCQCTIPNITRVTTFGQDDSWVQNLSQLISTSVAVDNDNNDISHLSTSLE